MQAIVAKYRERIASGWTWMRRSHTGKTLDPVLRNDPAATYVAGTPRVGVRAGVKCGTSINMRYRASITQESVCFMLAWFYVAQVNRSSALQMLWRTGSGTGSHWFGRKDNGLLISGVGAELTGTLRPNSWNSVVLTDQGYLGGTDIFVNGRLESQRAPSLFWGSTSVTIDIGDDAFGQPFLEPLAELYFINGRLAHADPIGTPDSTDAMALHKLGPGALSLTQRMPITRVYFDMGAGGGATVTPSTASLTLTTFAPTVTTPQTVTPGAASLTLTTFAPTVSTPVVATPGVASLTTTGFAPTVTTPQTVTPTTAALTLTTFAPTVTVSGNQVATPDTATLTLTTYAPTIGGSQTATPDTVALAITTYAPTVSTPVVAIPTTATLSLTTFAPTILTPVVCTPGVRTLTLTTYRPNLGDNPLEGPPSDGGVLQVRQTTGLLAFRQTTGVLNAR